MAKIKIETNPHTNQIFEDLEKYMDFCISHGYKYDEADLYNNKSHAYRQFNKFMSGKTAKNMWETDAKN